MHYPAQPEQEQPHVRYGRPGQFEQSYSPEAYEMRRMGGYYYGR